MSTATLERLKALSVPLEATFDLHPDASKPDQVVTLHLRGIGPRRYSALLAECPPSDADAQLGIPYDPAAFPARLLEACTVSAGPAQSWRSIDDGAEPAEAEAVELFATARSLCRRAYTCEAAVFGRINLETILSLRDLR